MATGSSKELSFIAPERLYTLKGFMVASGVSATRMREARRAGISAPMLEVGRRKFLRGSDAIKYLEQLSQLTRKVAKEELRC
jgi:hypothetical protein